MKRLYISMYHYTRDLLHSRHPNIKGLDSVLFEKQLKFFRKEFHPITMEDVIEAVIGGKELPEKALLLTFDDGYIDNFTVALPLLRKYDMQGSFFIPGKTFTESKVLDVNKIHFILASAPIETVKGELLRLLDRYRSEDEYPSNDELYEQYGIAYRFDTADVMFVKKVLQTAIPERIRNRIADELFKKYVSDNEKAFSRELYMNRDQIGFMKSCGMHIGIHGYDHYWLGELPEEQMQQDIDKALDVMDEFIYDLPWVMNYPYGNYNDRVISYIKNRGCSLGVTTEVRIADLDVDDVYAIPRLDCNDFPPKSENYRDFQENF